MVSWGAAYGKKGSKSLRGHEIVLVPQSVSYLDPLMKIGDQIQNGKKDVSVKEKCLAVLKRYGLAPDIRGKYPFQLSGGHDAACPDLHGGDGEAKARHRG